MGGGIKVKKFGWNCRVRFLHPATWIWGLYVSQTQASGSCDRHPPGPVQHFWSSISVCYPVSRWPFMTGLYLFYLVEQQEQKPSLLFSRFCFYAHSHLSKPSPISSDGKLAWVIIQNLLFIVLDPISITGSFGCFTLKLETTSPFLHPINQVQRYLSPLTGTFRLSYCLFSTDITSRDVFFKLFLLCFFFLRTIFHQ